MMQNTKDALGTKYRPENDKEKWQEIFNLKKEVSDPRVLAQLNSLAVIHEILQKGIEDGSGVVKGIALDKNGNLVAKTTSIQDSGLSAEHFLSGHTGRLYFDLPAGIADSIINAITGNNTAYNPIAYYASTDQTRVVYPRFAATHGVKFNPGEIKEQKLSTAKAAFNGMKNYMSGYSHHFGLDVPMKQDDGKIHNDGEIGHMYINLERIADKSAIGFGLEGSAPMKGNHSMSGASDRYSAFGGPKCYIKVEARDKNMRRYLEDFSKELLPDQTNAEMIEQKLIAAKDKIEAEINNDRPNIQPLYSQKVTIEDQEIYLVRTKDDKNVYLMTKYAVDLMRQGATIPEYIGGTTITIDQKQNRRFIDFIATKDPALEVKLRREDFARDISLSNGNIFGALALMDEGKRVAVIKDLEKDGRDIFENYHKESVNFSFWEHVCVWISSIFSSWKPTDVNGKNEHGQTPLHVASAFSSDLTQLLIDDYRNIDLNLQDQHGKTPLHYAVAANNVGAIATSGAQVDLQDQDGKTPLDYAQTIHTDYHSNLSNPGQAKDPINEILKILEDQLSTKNHPTCC